MKSAIAGAAAAAAVFSFCVGVGAVNGVIITEKITNGGTVITNTVQIEASRMRAEMAGQDGGKTVVVFDGNRQVLDLVNVAQKTYNEMTKQDAEALGGMMAQVQAQLANLPPAQRAQIEAAMKGRGGLGGATKTEYRKAGTETVGKWTCDKYEAYENGQKTSEICTVDPKTLGFTAADFAVTRKLMEFIGSFLPNIANQMFSVGDTASQGYSGIPVKSTRTIAGQQATTELTDITRGDIPEANFQVPADYQKQPFPGLGGGRR
jgi:hypothetical protein